VDDWNMGTLLRLNANKEVSDANTVIGETLIYCNYYFKSDIEFFVYCSSFLVEGML